MKVLILTNHQLGLYKFRRELLERMVSEKMDVYISVPDDKYTRELEEIGTKLIINRFMDRRGTNPFHDIKLLKHYKELLKKIGPDVVLTYTIKPNAYGGYLCGKMNIPYISNVTGLGTSIQNGGFIQKFSLFLYKKGLKHARRVFFQNEENRSFMLEHGVVAEKVTDILPGSGVNIAQHSYEPYPADDSNVIFTTIGRIMKDKGIDELLSAAKEVRSRHPETEFRLIGDYDEGYADEISEYEKDGVIRYLGFQNDVHRYIAESHAVIHASYHEGMSNVLLESASAGRPVLATSVHGCIETFDPDVTGIAFEPADAESLVNAVERFLDLTHAEKEAMGKAGREKMEREFNRDIVIEKYISEIKKYSPTS